MTRLLRLTLLLCVLTSPALAASQTPATPADDRFVEELTELEEVRVRAKLVANALITMENRVFRLYNKLNTNNRFDVHCMDLRLDRDSLPMQRTCLPEFLDYAPPVPMGIGGYGYVPPPPFSHAGTEYVVCTDTCYAPLSLNSPQISYQNRSMATFSGFSRTTSMTVATSRVPEAQRTEYADNVLRVIRSDPELLDLATDLAGMYKEMDRVKAHYAKLRQERQAARAAKRQAVKDRARAEGRRLRATHPRAT